MGIIESLPYRLRYLYPEEGGNHCVTSIQAEMDLRQFGEYNQFKILRQTASRESKKYFALFQSESKETVELFFGMSLFLILKIVRYDCCPYPYVNLNFLFR